MKINKISVICLSALFITAVGCDKGGKGPASSGSSDNISSFSLSSQQSSSSVSETFPSDINSGFAASSEKSIAEVAASSSSHATKKTKIKRTQNDSGWVAYDTNKDGYKLHIKRKDGSGDKVIVDEAVLAPCVADKWVYYFADLNTIEKVKLDGSQKTKVCNTDAMDALNANTEIVPEYKGGYILYKLIQLRESGDNRPHTVTYYKLDLSKNKIIPVKNK